MKFFTVAAALAATVATVSAATIAEWDFTKSLNSSDGKYLFKSRVADQVKPGAEGAVFTFPAKKDTDAGITSVKSYKELTPQGAFELTITFKPDWNAYSPKSKTKYSVLFDNKYYYTHKSDKSQYHSGMMVRASINDGNLNSTLYLGFGNRTVAVSGNRIKSDGKSFHTLKIKYELDGTVTFSWDNQKPLVRKIKNPGTLSQAGYPLVIGDRYSSTRMPFQGVISKITLSSVDSAATPAQK